MPTELVMTLETGDVTIKLRPDLAPNHVERVCRLAEEGFYDGAPFGRVNPKFLYQAMPGRSSLPDLKPEFSDLRFDKGVCAMARDSEPDSANAGFFIMAANCAFIACQYTIWGEVIVGMEHVEYLPEGEPPAKPGRIVSMLVR